jgi:hypothetical protein
MKRAQEAEGDDTVQTFQIDALPTEILINIAYHDLSVFKFLFQVNTTLHRLQSTNGFWVELFKLDHPETALTLACFLQEAPALVSLRQESKTDILLLLAIFDTFDIAKKFRKDRNEYDEHLLGTIETNILDGNLSAFEVLYEVNMSGDGTLYPIYQGYYAFRAHSNLHRFVMRNSLISFYQLLERLQQVNTLDKTLEFVESLKPDSGDAYYLKPDCYLSLLSLWRDEFAKQKVGRLTGIVNELDALSKQFQQELSVCYALNENTGKPDTAVSVYFPRLATDFREYFGLTDEEASKHWKKIYTKLRKRVLAAATKS